KQEAARLAAKKQRPAQKTKRVKTNVAQKLVAAAEAFIADNPLAAEQPPAPEQAPTRKRKPKVAKAKRALPPSKKGAKRVKALPASEAEDAKIALPPAEEIPASEEEPAIDVTVTDETPASEMPGGETVASEAASSETPTGEETPGAEVESAEEPAESPVTEDETEAGAQETDVAPAAVVSPDAVPTIEETEDGSDETADAEPPAGEPAVTPVAKKKKKVAGAKKGAPKKGKPKHAAKRKRVTWRSKRVLIPTIVVASLIAIYVAGCAFFSTHVLPGTTVAGEDMSFKSRNALAQRLGELEDSYTLTATHQDFSVDVPGRDVSLTGDYDAAAKSLIKEQKAMSWPTLLFVPKEAGDLGLTYNEEALVEIVTAAVDTYNENKRAPLSATLEYDEGLGRFVVVDEQPGTALSSESVATSAGEGLKRMDANLELTDEALAQPALTADSAHMKEALNDANRWFELTIPLTLKDKKVTEVTSDLLASWLHLNKDLTVKFDETKIKEWVDEKLWKDVDYADSDGLNVLNTEKFAPQLIKALQNGETKALELPMNHVDKYLPYGPNTDNSKWISSQGRYIEVDKSEQIAVLYSEKGDILWESEVVTGNQLTGQDTPEGVFAIYAKESNYTLVGFDNDGDGLPDYEHDVSVWLPFVDTIGLHDATWRGEFGGYIYTYDGSNGCVNLPLYSAEALYDMTHVGEKVIVKS
ncbi:MAG: L,D-transpeptidase family protein, partial [Coriobacteriales bacterium]|nr:L,D-transpeptidase family protein [Coriobacteriales bacterium]